MEQWQIEEQFAQRPLTRKTLARLWRYMGPHGGLLALTVLISAVGVGSTLLGPKIIQKAIDGYMLKGDARGLALMAALFLVNSLAVWVFLVAQARLVAKLGQVVLNDLRMAIFRHIQVLSMSYFDRTKQGRIIARADSDLDSLEYAVSWGAAELLTNLLVFLGTLCFMASFNWKLCLAVLAMVPAVYFISQLFQRRGLTAFRRIREQYSAVTANAAENITGVRVVQAFARQGHNAATFRTINNRLYRAIVGSVVVWGAFGPALDVLGGAGTAVILGYGGYLVSTGALQIGELSAFVLYLGMFFGPVVAMTEFYSDALSASAAAERIFALLDTEPEVKDVPGAIALPPIQGHVVFEHVHFRYSGDSPDWVLKDISFQARPGQTIALVGPTGAGKSSIMALLARFYEPQQGRILIDGHDTRAVTLHSLHSQMGIVLQDSFLFSGTVMDNLRYGRPGAVDEQVIAAAQQLGAEAIIAKLAQGYQTDVKERGVALSQGERQLICFARALVADPRILILDEATSSVDTQTELALQRALERLLAGRTCFIVAHRLSTVRHADKVLVVQGGQIVEEGTHAELLARGGVYARMYHEFIRA